MRASLWSLLSAGGLLQSRIMLAGTHYSAWVGVLGLGTLGPLGPFSRLGWMGVLCCGPDPR